MNWRPDNWVNPHKEFYERNPEVRPKVGDWDTEGIYESGASAMLSAVIKWLDEPCKEHPKDPSHYNYWLSLRSSIALNNLMGAFPDLPDEVGQ